MIAIRQILPILIADILLQATTALAGSNVPYLVKDINPSGGSDPMYLAKVGNLLYFAANDGVHGRELWVSDGTEAGTRMVVDLRPGSEWSDPVEIHDVNGKIFFQALNGADGYDLYVTDGTASGTTFLTSVEPFGFDFHVLPYENVLLFQKRDPGNSSELWKSDGTPEGTELVKDVDVNYIERSGPIVFLAGTSPGSGTIPGFDLWKTDGTTSGTQLLADLEGCLWITDLDGRVFFHGERDDIGVEPWISDGTVKGTHILKDIEPGAFASHPNSFSAIGDIMYFTAFQSGTGREPWRSDGTTEGTYLLKDINPTGNSGAGLYYGLNGLVVFPAIHPDLGSELWISDGTNKGTYLLQDIRPGSVGSDPDRFALSGGKLFFKADDGIHGREVWVTDGTPTGTVMVGELNPGPLSGVGAGTPVDIESILFFTGGNSQTGGELWAIDNRSNAIPALSTWSIVVMLIALAVLGSLILQRSKENCISPD